MAAADEQVQQIADDKLGRVTRLQVRRELKFLAERLAGDESLLALASAESGKKDGLIAVTDRRLMFLEKGMVRTHIEEFPFGRISSVESTTRMRKGTLTVHSSGNSTEFTDVHPKSAVGEIAGLVRERATR